MDQRALKRPKFLTQASVVTEIICLPRPFPIWSILALLYPISAMGFAWLETGNFSFAWNYGLGNLGYLLFAAGIYPGTFRALGLEDRLSVFIVAIIAWVTSQVFIMPLIS